MVDHRSDDALDVVHETELDESVQRVVQTLRVLPDVDGLAKARLLIAVAGVRERDRETGAAREHRRRVIQRSVRWVAGAGALAAAALVGALLLPMGKAPGSLSDVARAPAPGSNAPPTRLAVSAGDAVVLVPVQLVFKAPDVQHVQRVQVAGDFNGWNASAAPLTRDAATGLWSTTLSLRPGRHVYAFVVNDSEWVRDPRAPSAPDADFGRPGSVMLVGRP